MSKLKKRGTQWRSKARRLETAIEASYFAPRLGITKEEAISIIRKAPRMKDQMTDHTSYETGARTPKPGKSLRPDPIHTGDPADEPKKPYGLVEDSDDFNEKTRHSEGRSYSHPKLKGHPG